ncbi:MAG TPA: DUF4349 domain-containing protein [Candidatus Binatus sp.]|nr:DUF4349 domain-containing protein [Candidatus Binatus sp.]
MTIHDNIDNYLAADLHNELSDRERDALHAHLVECAACRQTHQETKIMNKVLEKTLTTEKPDPAFEQRMLAGFRNRNPQKTGGIAKLVVDLMRLRATQITAVVALLLALVQVGRMITGEGASVSGSREMAAGMHEQQNFKKDEDAVGPAVGGGLSAPMRTKTEGKPDMASFGSKSTDLKRLEFGATSNQPQVQPEFRDEEVARSAKVASIKEPQTTGASENQTATPNEGAESLPLSSALANRKLIRNAKVELEVESFDATAQKITAFVNEERGYVATTSSEKQANGKLRGEVVVKVIPENLDRFLQKVRGLGVLKNQSLGTEDVTKAYFDTDSRLKNARVMEQRLIDILKTKTGKVSDLLQVEKELGRVREDIEKMQGALKYMDAMVQFATVTISIAEKDLEEPAAFLLKERAQLALYAPEVEKVYNDIKALASPKTQITNAQLNRDNIGRISARVSMLIAPEESEGVITRVKAMGRVENFQVQTERVAQGGAGMSENAKTKRDKVELNITLSREEQEEAFQQTSLRIRTSTVDEKTKELRNLTGKQNGRIRSLSFSRDPDGREFADVSLRAPMRNYNALMQSLNSLGRIENVTVQRQDRTGAQTDEANAPADLSIQIYSQGNIVSRESGLFATLRRTLGQSAGAIMWSLRMIGVALAFLAPWMIALVAVVWIGKRVARTRRR